MDVKYSSPDRRFTSSADLYRITKTNVPTTLLSDPNFSVLTGSEELRGFGVDGAFRPRTGLLLRASVADTLAFVSNDHVLPVGDRFTNVSRYQGNIWAEQIIPHRHFRVGIGYFAVGRRQVELPNTQVLADTTD